jgi:O-antigen/teichoic acid export membrane protein
MSIRLFLRNSILLLSAELMAKLLGVIFFVLVARSLGASQLGSYSFAVAIANLFVIAPRFGFDELVQREYHAPINTSVKYPFSNSCSHWHPWGF